MAHQQQMQQRYAYAQQQLQQQQQQQLQQPQQDAKSAKRKARYQMTQTINTFGQQYSYSPPPRKFPPADILPVPPSDNPQHIYEENNNKKDGKMETVVMPSTSALESQTSSASRNSSKVIRNVPAVIMQTAHVVKDGMRLSHPDDESALNRLHCFVRSTLLEVVIVVKPRSEDSDRCFPTNLVGIRCAICGRMSKKERRNEKMPAFFPKSVQDIYRGVFTWQRIHFGSCEHMPEAYKESYKFYKDSDLTRGRKRHWITSAYDMGLRNIDANRSGVTYNPNSKIEEFDKDSDTNLGKKTNQNLIEHQNKIRLQSVDSIRSGATYASNSSVVIDVNDEKLVSPTTTEKTDDVPHNDNIESNRTNDNNVDDNKQQQQRKSEDNPDSSEENRIEKKNRRGARGGEGK